jgi:hypothetical protein
MQLLKVNPNLSRKEKVNLYRKNKSTKEAIDEWESWKPLILRKLKEIDHQIQMFYSATSRYGGKSEDKQKFVVEELTKLIKESVK